MSSNILYIADLPQNTDKSILHEVFDSVGTILDIQIIPKPSSCSAKVTFSTHEEAERGLVEKLYTKIHDKPMHITWNRENPRHPDSENTIVINGLDPSIEEPDLHKVMEGYGKVLYCRITRNMKNQSTGKAIIFFEDAQGAHRATDELSNAEINGRSVTISKFVPKPKNNRDLLNLPHGVVYFETKTPNIGMLQKTYPAAFHIQILESGALLYFPDIETTSRTIGESKSQLFTKAKLEIVQAARLSVESRLVCVSGLRTSFNQDSFTKFFSQAGKVINVEPVQTVELTNSVVVQYDKPESRDKSLAQLDLTIIPGQNTPIRVLPFIDKTISHQLGGLVQFNELDPSMTRKNLKQMFPNSMACSVSPTEHGTCYGFVMFKSFGEATVAVQTAQFRNFFIYPPIQYFDAITSFSDDDPNCVAIYNFDPSANEKTILSDLATRNENSFYKYQTAALLFYSNSEAAIPNYLALKQKKYDCDLLSSNTACRVMGRLASIGLCVEWSYHLVFFNNLDQEYGAKQLRELLESKSVPVVSCFVNLLPGTGQSKGNGIILFTNPNFAQYCIANPQILYDAGHNVQLQYYNNKIGYTVQYNVNYQMPSQPPTAKKPWTPREFMKQFVYLNFKAKDVQAMLLEKIDQLSVNDSHNITANYHQFIQWIEQWIAQK